MSMVKLHPSGPRSVAYPKGITIETDWENYNHGSPIGCTGVLQSPEHCTSLDFDYTGVYATTHPTVETNWSETTYASYGYYYIYITAYYDDATSEQAEAYFSVEPPA